MLFGDLPAYFSHTLCPSPSSTSSSLISIGRGLLVSMLRIGSSASAIRPPHQQQLMLPSAALCTALPRCASKGPLSCAGASKLHAFYSTSRAASVSSSVLASRTLRVGRGVTSLSYRVLRSGNLSAAYLSAGNLGSAAGLGFSAHCSKRAFSSTSIVMAGTKIDGTAIAKDIRERLKAEIAKTQEINPRFKPSLVIFQGMSSICKHP